MNVTWNPGMSLEDIEEKIIKSALAFFLTEEKTALSLKITLKDLHKKIKKYEEKAIELEKSLAAIRLKEEEFVRHSRGINYRLQ